MKKKKVTIYKNGATVRYHNKRIVFEENEKKDLKIEFSICEKDAHIPAVDHLCEKGVIRRSLIHISEEAFEALIKSYSKYKKTRDEKK